MARGMLFWEGMFRVMSKKQGKAGKIPFEK